MRVFQADLHIHSCLSPCAELDMTPRRLTRRSKEQGLDIIAVCDHNSAENVEAAMRAGQICGLRVLPGMELNSREEVHLLALFETAEQALTMQAFVYRFLKGTNRPDIFGDQVVVNEEDEVEGFNDRFLIGALELGVGEIAEETHRLGGVSIASHVDRPRFSLISQLGFIPPQLDLDAIEVVDPSRFREGPFALLDGGLPWIATSDAHFLSDVGQRFTRFTLAAPTLEEIRLALVRTSGRTMDIAL